MKKLKITIEGKVYEVTVEILNEGASSPAVSAPTATAKAAAQAPAASAIVTAAPAPETNKPVVPTGNPENGITSPLSGKVVEVAVVPGQDVAEGDLILTLEAMKMNTYIYAPKDGKVDKVHVTAGSAVEDGQLLVSLS